MQHASSVARRLSGALLCLTLLVSGCASAPSAQDPDAPPVVAMDSGSPAQSNDVGSASPAADVASPVTLDDADARTLTLLTLDGMLPQKNVDAANVQLSRKGIPFRLQLRVVPHDQYYEQMMSAADVDLILSDRVSALYAFGQGRVADLAPLLTDFAALRETAPAEAWAEFARSGAQVAYPLTNSASDGGWETGVLIRRDILTALGASDPQTPEELLALCLKAKEAGQDYRLAVHMAVAPYAFHRTYDEWPFYVDTDSLLLYRPDGAVDLYADTSVFTRDAGLLREFFAKKVLRPLRYVDEVQAFSDKFDALAALYPIRCGEKSPHAKDVAYIQFAPDKANFRIGRVADVGLAVSTTTREPSDALTLLQALYADADIRNALVCGQEDTDWEKEGETGIRMIGGKRPAYGIAQCCSLPAISDAPVSPEEAFSAKAGTLAAFPIAQFNTEAGDGSLDAIRNAIEQTPNALYGDAGVYALRSRNGPIAILPDCLKMLRDAGADTLREETEKQFRTFLSQER